jgi:hypothetical protein
VFDFRYHALSLAAVLLALAVGVLLGVAIGDSNLVSSAKNGVVAGLRVSVSAAQRNNARLRDDLNDEGTVEADLYALAVSGTLQGKNVGLVFLGGSSNAIDSLVRSAVAAAGGDVGVVVAVREPLDLPGLEAATAHTRYALLGVPGAGQAAPVEQFGQRVGIQLARGGTLLARTGNRLLSSLSGAAGGLGAVVLVRDDPGGLTAAQQRVLAAFQTGLVGGLQAAGAPVVGAELTATNPSQVAWYESEGISSVDDLDLLAGRTALALALAGDHGTFGVKRTADSLLPQAVSGARPGA